MATFKITEEQKQRIIELYETPTSELSSKEIPAILKEEMNIEIPSNLLGDFYLRGFGLKLSERKRKSNIIKIEFETGETIILNNENKSVDENTVNDNGGQNETRDSEEIKPVNYEPHHKEPVNFEF